MTALLAFLGGVALTVLALLTLLFASAPSTRSLGLQAATGLVVAAVFALVVLPPLLSASATMTTATAGGNRSRTTAAEVINPSKSSATK